MLKRLAIVIFLQNTITVSMGVIFKYKKLTTFEIHITFNGSGFSDICRICDIDLSLMM